MKRFLLSVTLCFSLLLIGLFCFMPSTDAQTSVLPALLNLPAPPPPNPSFQPNSSIRDENFYDKGNPPKPDAPIDDLLEYWKRQNQFDSKTTYAPKPDEKSLERLMAEVGKKPELLDETVNLFPDSRESAEFVKRLYDAENSQHKYAASWRSTVKNWLTYHSNYFSDDLYQAASRSAETPEYVTNQDEVLALAKIDWDKAQPLLERMLSNSQQPVSQTLARWAFYKHALAVNNSFDADKYRRELQETVENKSFQAGNRDLAMDALVQEGDFSGRDDWYYSLLEDETLYELRVNGQLYTGLTTLVQLSPDDKYVAKMIELAGNGNPTIRNAAVRNLSTLLDTNKNPEMIKALLPWLENPKWAKEVNNERAKILAALQRLAIPESVSGLIAMLNEKEKTEVAPLTNGNSNVAVYANRAVNVPRRTDSIEVYPFRSGAIRALAVQKSPLAAGALRQILPFVESWERQTVVEALLASNGFTIAEQVDALEEVAKNVQREQISANVAVNTTSEYAPQIYANTNAYYKQQSNPNELKLFLGTSLTRIENPSDELVKAVLSRVAFLEKKNPPVADNLRLIIQNWKGTAINSLVLKDLKDGKTNIAAIIRLLTIRKDLREKQLNDVNDIRAGSPTALGISACLLEQTSDYDAILQSDNIEAKVAMLGCARMIRAPLPVQKVAVNLQSPNKLLALAAERYLETEDSPEARQIVLALHPNEAKILGARAAFVPDGQSSENGYLMVMHDLFVSVDSYLGKLPQYFFYTYGDDKETDKTLQKEVKENQELLGVYAYDDNFVRIYKDKAVFSWQDDPARYRERNLSAEEFDALKNFLAAQRVDELPPFLAVCEGCESKELLMLGRGGGRRVFVKADPLPPFFTELETIFTEFRRQPAQIHYYFEKDVAGLEVLYADDNVNAITVWKNGGDFRMLTDDLTLHKQAEKETEELNSERQDLEVTEEEDDTELTVEKKAEIDKERRQNENLARQKQFSSYAWYKFDKTKLLESISQPESFNFIPRVDAFAVPPDEKQWKTRAANVEIRADQEGLYKITGGNVTKIRQGFYYNPLVMPNGRWALATKYTEGEDGISLVRVNLSTNKELKITVKSDYGAPEAVAFIPALNKVLLFSSYGEGDGEEGDYRIYDREGEFFLLDAETGIVQPLKGEARPFLQQTFRPLQPTAAIPEAVWTVFPDTAKNATQFGIYNTKTLSFKPLLTIPKIIFSSMDMWVDEAEGKIYFVYEGQLLALPFKQLSVIR